MLADLREFEGEIRIADRSATHRILMRGRKVVAAHVAGHFDPLLDRLRQHGALSERAYRETLEAMASCDRRSGEVARRSGVDAQALEQALAAQLRDALAVLRRKVDGTRATATLHPRRIQPREIVAFARVGEPKRRVARGRSLPRHRALARIARELHPDRLMHLPEQERRRRERRLAHLSARLQGL